MDNITSMDRVPPLCEANQLTLVWIESHQPVSFPIVQSVQILLYQFLVCWGPDDSIQKIVIGKKTTSGRDTAWQVIDVHKEEGGQELSLVVHLRSPGLLVMIFLLLACWLLFSRKLVIH